MLVHIYILSHDVNELGATVYILSVEEIWNLIFLCVQRHREISSILLPPLDKEKMISLNAS